MSERETSNTELAALREQQQENARQARIVRILQRVRFKNKVLRDCAANEELILELPPMSPDAISQAFAANPKLAEGFLWIDPPPSKTDPTQLEQDRRTLQAAAKANRNFGASEANLSLCRDVLGAGFTEYQINQAIRSNALRLAAPTQEERDEWAALDQDQEQLRLRNKPSHELKAEAAQAMVDSRRQAQVEEGQRVLEAKKQAEAGMDFPPIPDVYQGKRVNQKFFKECNRDTMRWFLQRFGEYQVTQKIRGLE